MLVSFHPFLPEQILPAPVLFRQSHSYLSCFCWSGFTFCFPLCLLYFPTHPVASILCLLQMAVADTLLVLGPDGDQDRDHY